MPVARLTLPLTEPAARGLRIGDRVSLTGTVFTARDAVHRRLAAGESMPCDLSGAVLYHCGPVCLQDGQGQWRVWAAGPTTSIREEPYMPDLIERFRLRAVIGKGGMGDRTLAAMARVGCVYLHAVGGAAQALASCIESVRAVHGYELLGAPEAVWELDVRDFPGLVTMDSQQGSLHQTITRNSERRLQSLFQTTVALEH